MDPNADRLFLACRTMTLSTSVNTPALSPSSPCQVHNNGDSGSYVFSDARLTFPMPPLRQDKRAFFAMTMGGPLLPGRLQSRPTSVLRVPRGIPLSAPW
jgi:hypothetical protein